MNDHPEELLALYPDLLEEADRERVEGHLQKCEACRERVVRLSKVVRASRALPDLAPGRELDRRARQRMLDEARAHARSPRRWPLVVVPLAVAALVAAALLLRPPEPTVGSTDEWTAKGVGDPSGDAELQVALVLDGGTSPLTDGDRVPAGATLLLGGALPGESPAIAFLVHDERRVRIWQGSGDASTLEGGAWRVDGAPAATQVPDGGPFRLELWLGTTADDAELADRLDLVADEP
jgi:hypothetical protein